MTDATVATGDRPPDKQSGAAAVPQEAEQGQLRGRMGTLSVVLTIMAYLAPLAAAAGYIPLVISAGNGLGAPLIFLLCGVILTLFSFGFLAMVRHVPRPGAFYAYISAGLGKRIGLGAGALSLTFYQYSSLGFYLFGSLEMKSVVQNNLGWDLPWWVYSAVLLVVVSFCSYRGMDFNVKVLGIVVALEFTIIAAFNLVTLFRGGAEGYPSEPFTWDAFTSGSIAVGVLFAIAFFVGFESTAIYREEVRNPERTIPRSTYVAVGVISVFYFVTAYCLIAALGPGRTLSQTANDPAGTFTAAFDSMLGHAFSQIVSVMVVTSVLAAELAMVNASTRYVYSFGVDGVLPRALGAVHKRHGSPHRAAITTNAIIAVGILVVIVAGLDAQRVYGILSGVMTFGFETLILLLSLAAIVYFRRNRGSGESKWNVIIAPALSVISFGWLLFYSAERADLLTGAPTPLTRLLFVVLGGAFVVGIGYAAWLARRKPEVFARIGRATP
ncbi:APC family permease [Streptomyces sp. NBC_00144]|uniref:APC family permease n=1 Tax=Streptomyces sp. NBC_00144 TaxID=2975665 RepID=UPI0032536894